MSRPGDTITVTGTVTEKEQTEEGKLIGCEIEAEDQNRDVKLTGFFKAVISDKESE